VLQHITTNLQLINQSRWIKITLENRELHIDEVLTELYQLREENQQLKVDNDFLQRQNTACKLRCSKYALQVRELESEIADLKFTHNYLTSEEAGRQFARELLGGA
jgi:hypothetical protein